MHKAHGDALIFSDFIVERMGEEKFERLKMRAGHVKNTDLTLVFYALRQEIEGTNGSGASMPRSPFFLARARGGSGD